MSKKQYKKTKFVGFNLAVFTALLAVISTLSDLLNLPEIRSFLNLPLSVSLKASKLNPKNYLGVIGVASSFFNAARDNDVLFFKNLLMQGSFDLYKNNLNKAGESALHIAAQKGNYDVVKFFLENNVNANIRNIKNWTPLHHALRFKRVKVAELLIKNGANLWLENDDGYTPISFVTDELTQQRYIQYYNGISK